VQNWKIKRMSEKRINEWLKAINYLLTCYQKKERVSHCPFCGISGCGTCLWALMENMRCFDLFQELHPKADFTAIVSYRNRPKWRTIRIPMLRRWKKILKIELARREQ
jgi:hypothetical protein